ncbi:hypothetical protein Q767_11170 [Flavobacterium enshiense DK69]|uniref:Uncharacterized protein n=2 Tax=Flavobacterium TaxID=237 RepID=A0A0A2N4K2_9FLAO|nr:hypothetical protein Q767_11170 [Flavobacterium enshiense DK69]
MYSQVGIGTANPLADLHVAGNTSTIRIESLSAVNNPAHNDGIKPALAYVNALGDVTLNPSINNGTTSGGAVAPINFLLTLPDFIPNGPLNFGNIVTSPALDTYSTGLIKKVNFTAPGSALVEVKYCISSLISMGDLNLGLANLIPFYDISSRVFKIYFCIDINNDGLDAVEASKRFGLNAQSYASANQGILGYSFTNGHGYTTVPPGTHSIHFFAEIFDGPTKVTSIGFGGAEDTIKVRVYN